MDAVTLEAMAAQIEELTRTAVMWMVISVLLVVFLFAILLVSLRTRRHVRLLEATLERELHAVREGQATLLRRATAVPAAAPAGRTRPAPQQAGRASRPQKASARPSESAPRPMDLTATVNEMLAGNQPYNFIEALRAMAPGLHLERLTPSDEGDMYDQEPVLEPGGDGLFALVRGDAAQLYPNYGRFSATLDPKPFFEGARHGGRIHSVLQPARLRRREDGAWIVLEKGRVQMRQGA